MTKHRQSGDSVSRTVTGPDGGRGRVTVALPAGPVGVAVLTVEAGGRTFAVAGCGPEWLRKLAADLTAAAAEIAAEGVPS